MKPFAPSFLSSPSFMRRAVHLTVRRGRLAFFMGLFGALFILATFTYIAFEQRNRLIERNRLEIISNAFFLADHAARIFEVSDLTLRQVAAMIEDESWYTIEPSRPLWEQLNAIKEALPYIDDIWLNDSSGKLRLTSLAFPTPDSNVADRDAFREQSISDKGLFVGEPIIGRVTTQPTFLVSRRLQYPNGSFRGIISVTVSISYLREYWSQIRLVSGGRIDLIRAREGTVLAQHPPLPEGTRIPDSHKAAFQQAIARNDEAGEYAHDAGGELRSAAYHRVGDLPLYVAVTMPDGAYFKPWMAQTRLYGVFALIALLALAALTALARRQSRAHAANAALLSEQVALRTGELQSESAALEILNRTGTTLAGELEIDHIMRNVTDAGVELTGAQVGAFFYKPSAIEPEEDEGEGYALYAKAGVASDAIDEDAMLQDARLLSPVLATGRIVRIDDLRDVPDGQDVPFGAGGRVAMRSYMAVPVVARTGSINGVLTFGHERPAVFTERTERLMQGLAGQAAIALENGRLYRAAQHEIEERKQSQAQQSFLIRELHHRVKNTLATVQAVVGATARSTSSIDDFYQAFVGRIISLANTHSLLTEAIWQTASLREIVEKELLPYKDAKAERVAIEGPRVELPSEAAVPIGMAIHELTTNAAKYGALSKPGGRVEVRWTSEPEGEDIRLKLSWTERDGPPVTPPTRQGFGSRLLHRVLTSQLNAQVKMDYDPEGLGVSLEMLLKQGDFLNPVVG